ncbi:hypothetical protein RRG08_037444 [Elysia crispata]|uniref:Uncharacterized protein n=1 Tax=Elysia crispata TaxID=231223 RepID=A0AAE1CSF9_9GAST|nr:hypothetical protein RRG08_037444 [Elysia crispata]
MPCCKLLEIKRPVPTCTASRWSKHARLSGADNTSDPGNTVTLPGGCKSDVAEPSHVHRVDLPYETATGSDPMRCSPGEQKEMLARNLSDFRGRGGKCIV